MKVFMLGWEFPPFISGGLGTACYGLTKAMNRLDIKVIFCLPKIIEGQYATHVKLLSPDRLTSSAAVKINELTNVTFRTINSALQPYSTPDAYQRQIEETLRQKQKIHNRNINVASQLTNKTDYGGDSRTMAILERTFTCPIVFEVMEKLKEELVFDSEDSAEDYW